MKNTIKKIEEIIESLYIKEILGITIYDKLHKYTNLENEVQELRKIALDYELQLLSNKPCNDLRLMVIEKINSIHVIALTIEDYRMSCMFFNEGVLDSELI